MKDVNKVFLAGRLGADPILRETKNGVAVAQFQIATSRRFRSASAAEGGEGDGYTEETTWHRIIAWGRQAEYSMRKLHRGDAVFVEGTLRQHKYEGKEGLTRISFEVHADDLKHLGSPRAKASQDGVESAAVEATPAPEAVPA